MCMEMLEQENISDEEREKIKRLLDKAVVKKRLLDILAEGLKENK